MTGFLNTIAFLLLAYYIVIAPFISLAKMKKSNATRLNEKKMQKAKQGDGSYLFKEPLIGQMLKMGKYIFFIILIINLFVVSQAGNLKSGSWIVISFLSIPSLLNIYFILANLNNFVQLDHDRISIKTKRGIQELRLEEIENASLIFSKPTAFSLSSALQFINSRQEQNTWQLKDRNLQGFGNEILAALKEINPQINTEKQYL
jgi:hypothetical protein